MTVVALWRLAGWSELKQFSPLTRSRLRIPRRRPAHISNHLDGRGPGARL